MKKLDEFKHIASSLLEADGTQEEKLAADRMYNLDWELPTSLQGKDWIQKRVLKFAYDTIESGKSAYATLEPNFNIVMPGTSEATQKRYDSMENLVRWQFMKASKRRGPIVATALEHAFLYGEVAIQVTHVDAQSKLIGGMSKGQLASAKKYGDYIISPHNPKDVRLRYTDLGLDGVLLIKVQTVAEFIAFWGAKAKPISDRFQEKDYADKNYVVSYDYMDQDERAIWANFQSTTALSTTQADGLKILIEEHGLPFFPWAASATPNRHGMLYPLYKAKAFELANLAESLSFSEIIAYAAASRIKVGGASDEVFIDYGQPGRPIYQAPGQTIEEFAPPQLDQNLPLMTDRIRADSQLVPEGITSGNFPANSAFASINQLTQTGLSKYVPYIAVVERALEQVGCLVFDWAKYLNKPITSPKNMGGKSPRYGGEFTAKPTQYEYGTDMSVALKEKTPIDRQVQVQTEVNAINSGLYDLETAREHLGENDPGAITDKIAKDGIRNAVIGGEIGKITAEKQLEAQMITMGLQKVGAISQTPEGMQLLQQLEQQLAQAAATPTPQGQPQQQSAPSQAGYQDVPGTPNSPPDMMEPGTSSPPMATGMDRQGVQRQ